MQKLRYLLRAGLGLAVVASMFVVPFIARAGTNSVDLSVTISDGTPGGNTPPRGPDPVTEGFDVSYYIEVTNNGADPTSGSVTLDANTTGARFITWYPQDEWTCSGGGDGTGGFGFATVVHANDLNGNSISCDGPSIAANGSSTFNLVVKAPSPGSFTTDVHVFSSGDNEANPNDNDATEQTTSQAKDGDNATGFLPPDGGKLKTDGQPDETDDTNSSIKTIRGSGPGGVFELHDQNAPNNFCGGNDCDGKVVEVVLPDGYNDKQNPPKLKLIYDVTAAGDGENATIYGQKPPDPTIFEVPKCDVDGVAKPHPCEGTPHVKKNGDIRYVVYLLSGDPIFGKH